MVLPSLSASLHNSGMPRLGSLCAAHASGLCLSVLLFSHWLPFRERNLWFKYPHCLPFLPCLSPQQWNARAGFPVSLSIMTLYFPLPNQGKKCVVGRSLYSALPCLPLCTMLECQGCLTIVQPIYQDQELRCSYSTLQAWTQAFVQGDLDVVSKLRNATLSLIILVNG